MNGERPAMTAPHKIEPCLLVVSVIIRLDNPYNFDLFTSGYDLEHLSIPNLYDESFFLA